MNINNLIEINDFATSDLIEFINLIELIEAQKEDLIENNLNEINEQFVDIKVNITDNQ
ncbi:37609_t:CDS:2 [Gigaspora margarita]|uniref:37609_t:CDS:1 n=1 Tax=Gigaspora margarita TaxID=4874 RepID=A0ABN7UXK3_GIGMA|nr:37609_t:CDS:2 [Gigaspora margarita]